MTKIGRSNTKKHQQASATVELLIVMPFFLLVLFGGMDLARVIRTQLELTSAVRSGVAAGAMLLQQKEPDPAWSIEDDKSITILLPVVDTMESVFKDDLGINLSPDVKTVLCRCVSRDAGGDDIYGAMVACGDTVIMTCTGYRQIHVRLQASLPFNTIFNWSWITGNINVSAAATMEADEI